MSKGSNPIDDIPEEITEQVAAILSHVWLQVIDGELVVIYNQSHLVGEIPLGSLLEGHLCEGDGFVYNGKQLGPFFFPQVADLIGGPVEAMYPEENERRERR